MNDQLISVETTENTKEIPCKFIVTAYAGNKLLIECETHQINLSHNMKLTMNIKPSTYDDAISLCIKKRELGNKIGVTLIDL